jgi:hypothetical protein
MAAVTKAQAAGVARGSSWIDRLTAAIDALPGPSIVVYAGASIAVFAIITISQWVTGGYPVGTVSALHAAFALLFGAWPWLVGRFNGAARSAIRRLPDDRLRDPSRRALLEHRLTALPATPTLLICLGGAAMNVGRFAFDPVETSRLVGVAPSSIPVLLAVFGAFGAVGFAYVVKVVVLSWRIHQVLTNEVVVSLFGVAPLYAFSRLTAAMAISMIGSILLVVVATPALLRDAMGFAGATLAIAFATLAFFLPLAGAHGLLVGEKDRRLGLARDTLQDAASSLHDAIQKRDTQAMDPLQKALAGVEVEQRMLERAPTWPWQPDTFRWVVGAVMFPIVLYVVQLGISRVVER